MRATLWLVCLCTARVWCQSTSSPAITPTSAPTINPTTITTAAPTTTPRPPPPDVTEVIVKTRSETHIELEWTKVNNILHTYILENSAGVETPIPGSDGEKVTHTVSSLSAGTKYLFTLFTVFEGVKSTGFEFSAVTAPPDVTEVIVKTRSETDIELEWTNNILHTYILKNSAGVETTIPGSDGEKVTHRVSSLTAGTSYSFTLFTVFEGVKSTGHHFSAVTAPSDVTQVNVKTRNETHIELEWTKVNNINTYALKSSDETETPITGSVGNTAVTHTVSSLSAGTKYSFTLFTVFEGVKSAGYDFSAVTAPPDVTKVNVKDRSETHIELEWTKVININTYILRYSNGTETSITELDGNTVTHRVSSLSAATTYSFTLFTVLEELKSTGYEFSAVTVVCSPNSCPPNSICEERADNTFTCVCPGGFIFNGLFCQKAKVFPGELTLTTLHTTEMDDKTSELFKTTSEEIVSALNTAFVDRKDYVTSVVLSLRPATAPAKVLYRTIRVTADVENIFDVKSAIDADAVKTAIEVAAAPGGGGGVLSGATFTGSVSCRKEPKYCDEATTTCNLTGGDLQCWCKAGFVMPNTIDKTHCDVCPSGKKEEDGKCTDCPFGYAGNNCSDNHQLILIVVSCVLSLLLIISMSVTTFAFFRKTKGKKSKKTDAGFTYQNPAMQAKNQFPTNQIPTIPRVDTNQHRGGSGMEMTSGGGYSRPNPNMDRGMSGYRGNTPMENNGGGIGGVRSQTNQGFDRGANMSGYRANTPTNVDTGVMGMGGYCTKPPTNVDTGVMGMGGYRAQGNQNRSNEWGSPSQRNPPYEEPKSFNGSNFGMPRANQIVQPQDNPYNPYADRRGRF